MTIHHHHGLCFFTTLVFLYFFTNLVPLISARSFSIPSTSHVHKHKSWETFHNFIGCHPGQTQEGLSIVKNYFHRYGYIPIAPPITNFTDVFDKPLMAAIRTYQKNYHLNITGELDDNTVKHMIKPRCGVPDIIHAKKKNNNNGQRTRTWSTGKYKADDFHMGSYYTFFDGNPRWPVGTTLLTYAFGNQLNDDFKSAFERAFSRWAPWVNIEFEETPFYETANIKITFLYTKPDGTTFDGVLGQLAYAYAPTDGRFYLDAAEHWVASDDVTTSPDPNAMDLESVAVHEIGHLLGLGHSTDMSAVMWPYISTKTSHVAPSNDDIEGIKVLYGIN